MAKLWMIGGATVGAALVWSLVPDEPQAADYAALGLVPACETALIETAHASPAASRKASQVSRAAITAAASPARTRPPAGQRPSTSERLGLTVRLVSA